MVAIVLFFASGGRVRGHDFTIGIPSHVRAQKGGTITLGAGVRVATNARIIARRGHLVIGSDASIGKNCTLVAFADLHVGRRTLIGENASVHTENRGPPGARNDFQREPIWIGSDVWLGAGVVVTAGSTIADGITVGANSVVTRDLLEPGLYAGAPAVLIRPYRWEATESVRATRTSGRNHSR